MKERLTEARYPIHSFLFAGKSSNQSSFFNEDMAFLSYRLLMATVWSRTLKSRFCFHGDSHNFKSLFLLFLVDRFFLVQGSCLFIGGSRLPISGVVPSSWVCRSFLIDLVVPSTFVDRSFLS